MKYRFIGTEDGPDKITFMGQVEFERNGPSVDVTEPELLAKLKTHKSFKSAQVGRPRKEPEAPPAENLPTEEQASGDES